MQSAQGLGLRTDRLARPVDESVHRLGSESVHELDFQISPVNQLGTRFSELVH